MIQTYITDFYKYTKKASNSKYFKQTFITDYFKSQ